MRRPALLIHISTLEMIEYTKEIVQSHRWKELKRMGKREAYLTFIRHFIFETIVFLKKSELRRTN